MIPERLIPKFLRGDEEVEISTDLDRIRHLPEGPLKMAKFALWWTRKTVFTKPKPDNPAFFVALSEEEIVELLGTEYFEPGWELSYSFRNETLNLRRVEYVPVHPEHPDYKWWQVHIRGYHHERGEQYGRTPDERFEADTFELAAHFELEPTEYPRPHVEHVGLEIRRGAEALRDVFDAHGVEYEYRYPDGTAADIEDDPFDQSHGEPTGREAGTRAAPS
jgi:hypothetical protein